MGKESVTLSMELAKTQSLLFTISTQGLTQGSLIPQEHGLYRALKQSIRQNKLDLNLSKTKQPLPIITHL